MRGHCSRAYAIDDDYSVPCAGEAGDSFKTSQRHSGGCSRQDLTTSTLSKDFLKPSTTMVGLMEELARRVVASIVTARVLAVVMRQKVGAEEIKVSMQSS